MDCPRCGRDRRLGGPSARAAGSCSRGRRVPPQRLRTRPSRRFAGRAHRLGSSLAARRRRSARAWLPRPLAARRPPSASSCARRSSDPPARRPAPPVPGPPPAVGPVAGRRAAEPVEALVASQATQRELVARPRWLDRSAIGPGATCARRSLTPLSARGLSAVTCESARHERVQAPRGPARRRPRPSSTRGRSTLRRGPAGRPRRRGRLAGRRGGRPRRSSPSSRTTRGDARPGLRARAAGPHARGDRGPRRVPRRAPRSRRRRRCSSASAATRRSEARPRRAARSPTSTSATTARPTRTSAGRSCASSTGTTRPSPGLRPRAARRPSRSSSSREQQLLRRDRARPPWSGGQYDSLRRADPDPDRGPHGRRSTPELDETLLHELTHAFVADLLAGRGAARDPRGPRPAAWRASAAPARPRRRGSCAALADGRIQGVTGFYLASLSFVEYLVAQRGQGGINDLLRGDGRARADVDAAFRAGLRPGRSTGSQADSGVPACGSATAS